MFWWRSRKADHRYYLLPGMGRSNRRKHRQYLVVGLVVGCLVSVIFGVLLYYLGRYY